MKPRLLDLFCSEGGASVGYARAGFDVVGVDIAPQPRYPFEFHQADALTFLAEHAHEFDAFAASPPCPHYANVTRWRGDQSNHPDLIPPTRDLLRSTGRPWVIENVMGAPMTVHFMLCGSMFGLPVRRHRQFEVGGWSPDLVLTPPCAHRRDDIPFMHKNERAFADALGCEWMSARGGRQAIPPAFTEFIGCQLLEALAVSS